MLSSNHEAHLAMRELWGLVDGRLREPDVVEYTAGEHEVREIETFQGARIISFAGQLSVTVLFTKYDGTDELIDITFTDDIRDLSESEITVQWSSKRGSGITKPPLKAFPKIANEFLEVLRPV